MDFPALSVFVVLIQPGLGKLPKLPVYDRLVVVAENDFLYLTVIGLLLMGQIVRGVGLSLD